MKQSEQNVVRRLSTDPKRCPSCYGKGRDGRDQPCKACAGKGEIAETSHGTTNPSD